MKDIIIGLCWEVIYLKFLFTLNSSHVVIVNDSHSILYNGRIISTADCSFGHSAVEMKKICWNFVCNPQCCVCIYIYISAVRIHGILRILFDFYNEHTGTTVMTHIHTQTHASYMCVYTHTRVWLDACGYWVIGLLPADERDFSVFLGYFAVKRCFCRSYCLQMKEILLSYWVILI